MAIGMFQLFFEVCFRQLFGAVWLVIAINQVGLGCFHARNRPAKFLQLLQVSVALVACNLFHCVNVRKEHPATTVALNAKPIQSFCRILPVFYLFRVFLIKMTDHCATAEASDWEIHLIHLTCMTFGIVREPLGLCTF